MTLSITSKSTGDKIASPCRKRKPTFSPTSVDGSGGSQFAQGLYKLASPPPIIVEDRTAKTSFTAVLDAVSVESALASGTDGLVRHLSKLPRTPARSRGIESVVEIPQSPSLSFSTFPAALPNVSLPGLTGHPSTPPSFTTSGDQSSFSSLEGQSPPPLLNSHQDFSSPVTPIRGSSSEVMTAMVLEPSHQHRGGFTSGSVISHSRPIPDQAAFESNHVHAHSRKNTPQRSPVCPPTPIRTPTWAQRSFDGQTPMVKLERKSSLSATKLLMALPPYTVHRYNAFLPPDFFYAEFENLGKIGMGAFSEVFKVRSRSDNGIYAVKKARHQFRSKKDRERMLSEVRTYEAIVQRTGTNNPNVIRYHRAWQQDGHFFTQSELCELGNLKDFLSLVDETEMPDDTIWSFIKDIANGLAHVHSAGIVHLDIKPQNIFIGASGILKIGDFGMAVPNGSEEDGLEGDNQYMAKELLTTPVKSTTADIFSLGLMIYEICANVDLPLEGVAWHNLREGRIPPLPPHRSPELNDVVLRMLNPDPQQRISAAELLALPRVLAASQITDSFIATYSSQHRDSFSDHHDFRHRGGIDSLPSVEEIQDDSEGGGMALSPTVSPVKLSWGM